MFEKWCFEAQTGASKLKIFFFPLGMLDRLPRRGAESLLLEDFKTLNPRLTSSSAGKDQLRAQSQPYVPKILW